MPNRWILALAIFAAAPTVASAQFTTFIAPRNPVKDSIKAAVVSEQRAVSDSITRAQITDMKTWVDSAAGVAATPPIPIDTTLPSRPHKVTTVTSNGVIAPATASPLPFVLALGGAFMVLGLMLFRRPRVKSASIGSSKDG